jgi:hypothetical protein
VELEPPELVEFCGVVLLGLDEEPGVDEEPLVPDEPLAEGVLELEVESLLELGEELDGVEEPEVPTVPEVLLLDDLPAADGLVVAVPEPPAEDGAVVLELLEPLRAGGLPPELLLLSPHAASASVPRIAVAIRSFLSMQICSFGVNDSIKHPPANGATNAPDIQGNGVLMGIIPKRL